MSPKASKIGKKVVSKEEKNRKKLADGRADKLKLRMDKVFESIRNNPQCLVDVEDLLEENGLMERQGPNCQLAPKTDPVTLQIQNADENAMLAITADDKMAQEAVDSGVHTGQQSQILAEQDEGSTDRNKTSLSRLPVNDLITCLGCVERSCFSKFALKALVKRGARTASKESLTELIEYVTNIDPNSLLGSGLLSDPDLLGALSISWVPIGPNSEFVERLKTHVESLRWDILKCMYSL